MLNVGARFGFVQRPQVARGDDALPQLLHGLALQQAAQFRLADQEALKQPVLAELEVRQHAQLFNGLVL